MVTYVELKGFEAFDSYAENIDPNGPTVLFYFSGSKLPDGNSWCPDCVVAEPEVKAFLGELNKEVIFAYVDVGEREYWKNKDCPFRTDNRIRLMVIPTLIKWKGVQRLEGSQCTRPEILQMLFEDDD